MEDKNHKCSPIKICSIILSAGLSSRMGKFKPLLEIDGVPAIKRIIRANKESDIENIIVVTGYNHKALEDEIKNEDVTIAFNPDYENGMFTSILTGIKKAVERDDFDYIMLFLGDVPLIPSEVITNLIWEIQHVAASYELGTSNESKLSDTSVVFHDSELSGEQDTPDESGVAYKPVVSDNDELWDEDESIRDKFYVPVYEGKKGHPLVIPKKYFDEILNHDGTNGLKGITQKYNHRIIRCQTDEEAVVLDMDNPEDYAEILAYYDKSKSPKLKKNILEDTEFGGTLYLMRHGSTRLHKEKIFMGQVDVPLSEEGIAQAQEGADELVNLNPNTNIIYTSPLLRALETAVILKDRFKAAGIHKDLIESSAFKEMSLGDWDGCYISDIKEKYPEEYEKRGAGILKYKRYPDGENHYDLKYRVLKELKKIMSATESGEDIILVSHKGVINAIRESILDLDSLEARNYNPPKGSVTVIDAAK